MRNLEALTEDPLAIYDAIVSPKEEPRRARLRGLRYRITCAYLRYYAHQPALEWLHPLGRRIQTQEADDLRYCYMSSRSKSSAVHDRVYAKILERSYFCAYCGIIEATTLDHYLPKDGERGYPEFSILPANLVPSCGRCNGPRGFLDTAGRRALIHPYFDVIPQERLLLAEVSVIRDGREVEFRVDLSRCLDKEFGRLYERHVRLLGLLDRYRVRAMLPDDGLSDIERTVRHWAKGAGRAEVAALLLEVADEYERRLGANHFDTALTRGAAASEAFVDYCLGNNS